MKQISLFFVLGTLLCLASCSPGGKMEAKMEPLPMITPYNVVGIRHAVKDYAKWKQAYMAHDSVRKAYGLEHLAVGRGIEDKNMVVVINKVADVQKAKDFGAMPELKTVMDSAGVVGAPMIDYMKVIRDDTSKISTKDRVMVKHHVKDFDAWLKVYDGEGRSERAANGIVDRGMARGIDDPNMVYLIFAITDMAKAKARMQSPELKKIMTDAGVDSQPEFFIFSWDE